MIDAFLAAGLEPTLDDMLNDPIVRALMQRDQVTAAEIRQIMAAARTRDGGGGPGRPGEPCFAPQECDQAA